MFRKMTILLCLFSFSPVAAGAQEVALLVNSQPAVERPAVAEPAKEINLALPVEKQKTTVMAANDGQETRLAEARPRKSHEGLTFGEFVDVHFGGYRWIYWVGAAAVIAAIHVFAVND